jgi:hypothetical protein
MFDIQAFTETWEYKGKVDPSLRDNVVWGKIDDALAFIKHNKPNGEHWLIQPL